MNKIFFYSLLALLLGAASPQIDTALLHIPNGAAYAQEKVTAGA